MHTISVQLSMLVIAMQRVTPSWQTVIEQATQVSGLRPKAIDGLVGRASDANERITSCRRRGLSEYHGQEPTGLPDGMSADHH